MQKKRDAAEIGKARPRMENEFAVRTRKRSDQPQSATGSHQNPECVCAAVRCVCVRKETRIGPERQQAHENVAERSLHHAVREQDRHHDKTAPDHKPGGEKIRIP